jgi:exosome complex exonuclease DIS3/RRP44
MEDVLRKVFFRRTRKGKVVRIVNDKYLRSDVGAGYHCGECISPVQLQSLLSTCPNQELIVLDTNIALQEIDVLEYSCPATACVLVPQTALQELRHLNVAVYQRLKTLMANPLRQFLFFPNELCEKTSIQRDHLESVNDANDRAIRGTALYLHSIVSSSGASAVLLTADKDCKKKALAEGLSCKTMRDHLQPFLKDFPELGDLLASEGRTTSKDMPVPYPAHLAIDSISAGLRSGKLLRGSLRVVGGAKGGPNAWQRCYAVVHNKDAAGTRRYLDVTGAARVNRAVDGDIVALELCDELPTASEDAFNRMVERFAPAHVGSSETESAGVSADVLEASVELVEGLAARSDAQQSSASATMDDENTDSESTSTPTVKSCAKVVGIIRRNWRQYAGSFVRGGEMQAIADSSNGGSDTGEISSLFQPVDGRLPLVRLSTRRFEELRTKRLLVAIDGWPANSAHPQGHYVLTLGEDGEKAVETQVLLHEFDVPHAAFTPEVMACLPPPEWTISEKLVAERTDLRHIPVVSIDPPGCKDIDDALHCLRLPNGHLQAGVHIADVTYFVHPETALDKEAAHRSTSTYLVERRLDMLPTLLTTELCSLRSKEDHLAFSVLWEFDDEGNIYDVQFCKSVIHSVASLTYDEAQTMLDDARHTSPVAESVRQLNVLARILRQRRIDMGALTLASPEVRFKLDAETQSPTDVTTYALKEANALVEEWMLLANITVSKKVLRHYPTLGLLRRHQPPSREQFEPLVRAARAAGVNIDISSSKALADSLDLAVRADDPFFNKLLRIMSTRCMMPAQYFCSGEVPKEQWHHYGLAAPVYTHFTSPIRRYADVIVHRLLASAIGVIPLPASNADRARQQELCSHLNRRHKAAQYVQRASVNLHTLLFFRGRPAEEVAYVLAISNECIVVLCPRFGVEGQVSIKELSEDLREDATFAEEFHSVAFGKKLSIAMFQQTKVRISVVDDDGPHRRLSISLVHGFSSSVHATRPTLVSKQHVVASTETGEKRKTASDKANHNESDPKRKKVVKK